MKSCPRCGKSYPDAETFCESDGSALVPAAGGVNRSTTVMPDELPGSAAGGLIVCPECHGKAEPGETICNFCGTQLQPDPVTPGASAAPPRSPSSSAGTAVTPENFVPSHGRLNPDEVGGEPSYDQAPVEEPSLRERIVRILGYSIAAIIAVAAGGWFALHLSSGHNNAPVTTASPAAVPATSAPTVALARNMQITVKGADLAAALNRDQASVRKVFEDNRDAVLDTYKRALEGDSTLHDSMVVRLHVLPDGSVRSGSVVISTSPNPSLDAEVVKGMGSWKYAAAGTAPVDVDYPLIFATNRADIGSLEADLSGKFASLGPNETPEYATAPPVVAPPPVAALPPPGAAPPPVAALPPPEAAPAPPPAIAALPLPEAPAMRPRRRHHRAAPPPPSITERVMESLAADKRLRRVQAYASGGGMVTLTGKVFDDDAKTLAERTVRNVNGVTGVSDNLTTETSVWARNESLINQRLAAEGLSGVTVKVIGNGAYLDGTVKTDLDRQRAETVAVSAAPVNVRTNLIKVDPGFFGF
jgi:BON domain/Double zinc ribbon